MKSFLVCLVLLPVPLMSAQARVETVTNFPKSAQNLNTCRSQIVPIFNRIYAALPKVKGSWTFAIVCDEATWRDLSVRAGFANDGTVHYGETFPAERLTLLRGWMLLYPDHGVSPARIVAHELAHANGITDEAKADAQAALWLHR